MQQPIKCFLIDNDEEDHEIFCMALQEIDPNIICFYADNGLSAVNKLKGDTLFIPSIIFVDMNMPIMNGTQCLKEIKTMAHLNKVPVYMYSTTAEPKIIEETKKLGAEGFIVKPASFGKLVEVLSQLFKFQNLSPF